MSRTEIKKRTIGKTKLTLNHAVPSEEITSREIYDKVVKAFVEAGAVHADDYGDYSSIDRGMSHIYMKTKHDKEIMWSSAGIKEKEIISVKDIDFGDEEGDDTSKGTSPWFGFKYRVNPETSRLLQEEVFKAGGGWCCGRVKEIKVEEEPYMFVGIDGDLGYCRDVEGVFFNSYKEPEKKIDIDPVSGKLIEVDDKGYITGGVKGGGMYFNMSDLVIPMSTEEYKEKHKGFKWPVSDGLSKDFLTKEESNIMSNNRRKVSVQLWDNGEGLDVSLALVAEYDAVTEGGDEEVIRQVLLEQDVKGAIDEHNKVRSGTVDDEILARTGNEVNLRPVKLKDLSWKVVSM